MKNKIFLPIFIVLILIACIYTKPNVVPDRFDVIVPFLSLWFASVLLVVIVYFSYKDVQTLPKNEVKHNSFGLLLYLATIPTTFIIFLALNISVISMFSFAIALLFLSLSIFTGVFAGYVKRDKKEWKKFSFRIYLYFFAMASGLASYFLE